ncbi:dienelactone hydrolase family protein [Burkholderia dolosa]|jgi:dienelactone hydrolase|uniref:dienelactone hydrolase family protein n=1 Tax=Burkholderia dolosa TaxID=152500 RepID=UPI001B8F04A4|nr:dienelactone hydrolase family protein [Burkholderia dolosa]MBR8059640.1 dienelactone hydrolase family protein [Burkholderia dolosa]MBR8311856.1 dienelactone hydrolase family protein [Burkholderia dolosa]
MRKLLMFTMLICIWASAGAQTLVHFPSTDGPPATMLDGYLFPAPGPGRHPALVFLHGCAGMFTKSGKIDSRERDWAERFNAAGITVLEVDSLTPRNHGEMCAPAHFVGAIYRARPFDAYGALRYLQSLDTVQPDRIGVVGWSQGGGTVLNTIRASSPARPASLPDGDFRAAVAFYPGSCNTKAQGAAWQSPVPLLVLIGEQDVWSPFAACKALFDSVAPGTDATFHAYPGAYHDFDWPDMPVHTVPAFTTRAGVVPIEGTDPAARADAQQRVVDYVAAHLLGN